MIDMFSANSVILFYINVLITFNLLYFFSYLLDLIYYLKLYFGSLHFGSKVYCTFTPHTVLNSFFSYLIFYYIVCQF